MGRKTNFLAKKRLDKYYRLAKDEGYQSRAAFKLIQINREYNFLGDCKCLIDLCAAPGGWTQVAAKYMPLSSQIIAVDLCKIKPIPGCVTIEADITTQKCKFEIKKHLHGYDVDCVLHDGAPNVSGAWTKDAYAQCELTLAALKLATHFLRVGGIFVTKVFRSADYNALLWVLQQLFDNVTSYKPMASRSSSAEIYLVCQDYLAPKKIDPRLLDPKFVFREVEEKPAAVSVMRQKKGKKVKANRDGYDVDGQLLYKTTSIMDFLNSESPEIILGEYNAFVFDVEDKEESKLLKEHTATNEEILALFSDLRLLAKSDFRRLLKWRVKMKRYLASLASTQDTEQQNDDTEATTATQTEQAEQGDEVAKIKEYTREEIENLEDEKLEADVREMFDVAKREKRKKKRKIRQEKIKRTRVMMMGGVKPGDDWNIAAEEQQAEGLFSLNKFRSAAELEYFMDGDNTVDLPNKHKKKKRPQVRYEEFSDSEAELEMQEARLDEMYSRYKKKHGMRTVKDERRMIRDGLGLGSEDEFSDDADDESLDDDDEDIQMAAKKRDDHRRDVGGGLVIDGEEVFKLKEDSKMMKATRWFSDNIFDDIETNENVNNELDEDEEIGDLVQVNDGDEKETQKEETKVDDDDDDNKDEDGDFEVVTKDGKKVQTEKQKQNAKSKTDEEEDKKKKMKYKDLPEVLQLPYKVRMKMKKMNRDHRRRLAREEEKRKERDCLFEEVPEDLGEDSTDSEAIAECQALGLKMIDKKARMDLIDGSYNKFAFDAFDDGANVPDWFKDDENANYKVNLPITKEEVREHKERLKAINARPIKKVAEAKARKKLKAMRIWNKIKKQATSIADNNDLSEKTKIKQIEKLYGKLGKKKNKRVYMISKNGRAARPASGGKAPKNATKVYVDKRMKSDKLGLKHSEKRKTKTTAKKIIRKQSSRRRQRNRKNLRRKR